MTAQAVGADFGMEDPPDPVVEAARREARAWIQAAHWGLSAPPLSPMAAQAVQQLRQEAVDHQAALRAEHAARNERERLRDLAAQRERERRTAAEAARSGQ